MPFPQRCQRCRRTVSYQHPVAPEENSSSAPSEAIDAVPAIRCRPALAGMAKKLTSGRREVVERMNTLAGDSIFGGIFGGNATRIGQNTISFAIYSRDDR